MLQPVSRQQSRNAVTQLRGALRAAESWNGRQYLFTKKAKELGFRLEIHIQICLLLARACRGTLVVRRSELELARVCLRGIYLHYVGIHRAKEPGRYVLHW